MLRRGRCARAWLTVLGSHESWANSTPLSELLALDSIEPCSSIIVQTSAPFGARRRMGDWMAAVVGTASSAMAMAAPATLVSRGAEGAGSGQFCRVALHVRILSYL